MNNSSIITANAVSKKVKVETGSLTILEDINLKIKPGESVAIVGPSGSGKSTLLSLLAGFDTPTSGTIEIDNIEISSLTEDRRARFRNGKISFVFQRFHLFQGLTALENVKMALELSPNLSMSDKSNKNSSFINMETEAKAILNKVGLSHRLNHYPYQLSGGEQQRVALARAFVIHPQIIFLDEPTGNLDVHTGETVIDLLFKLNNEEKTTLVIVTHEQSIAMKCSRILYLEEGSLKAHSNAQREGSST